MSWRILDNGNWAHAGSCGPICLFNSISSFSWSVFPLGFYENYYFVILCGNCGDRVALENHKNNKILDHELLF